MSFPIYQVVREKCVVLAVTEVNYPASLRSAEALIGVPSDANSRPPCASKLKSEALDAYKS